MEDERNVWARPAFLVSAVLVVGLVVLAVWLAATQAGGADRADPPVPVPSATPTAEPDMASVCGLAQVELDGTVVRAPATTSWSLVGTVAAPEVPGAGPGVVADDGLRTCYARTPVGALVAAANVVAMGSTDLLVPRMTETMTAAGPGRDAALVRLTEPDDSPSPAARYQLRGFRMLGYTGERASVDIAISVGDGALGSFVVDLIWQDGDWKVRLTEDGRLGSPPTQVPDLAGYTLWSGA
ncbi:hypothetical protein [Georgenia subflava]|uniref:DUF8175 domain-containing protein n=1 Tax=Georgenia subflava TaxID=1622177 RepID=A0A6N7EFZ5_9MICO|nr:hypothetical protein [Georgenia subflava]MPV36103.1 hypothetical protein [Georgenia subflava]